MGYQGQNDPRDENHHAHQSEKDLAVDICGEHHCQRNPRQEDSERVPDLDRGDRLSRGADSQRKRFLGELAGFSELG
jgi:hypothetical protein